MTRHLREIIRPLVDAAVFVVARIVASRLELFQVAFEVIQEERLDGGQEFRLVELDGDDAVAASCVDLRDDVLLAAHRVDRDERAAQIDLLQGLRLGRDLVGLGVRRDLAQRDPLLAGPGADKVERAEALDRVTRPTAGLAVDGDETIGTVCVDRERVGTPGLETALKGFGLEGDEQAAGAVARGDAMRQGEVLGQPGRPMLGPSVDGGGSVAASEDSADGDDGEIGEPVFAIARVAGVGERFEVGADGADVTRLAMGDILGSVDVDRRAKPGQAANPPQ
jgi:hypothetical protein